MPTERQPQDSVGPDVAIVRQRTNAPDGIKPSTTLKSGNVQVTYNSLSARVSSGSTTWNGKPTRRADGVDEFGLRFLDNELDFQARGLS